MSVLRAADAPTFTLPGIRFSGLTAPSRGGQRDMLLALVRRTQHQRRSAPLA